MPPRRIAVQPARRTQPKGFFGSLYHNLTSEENASVVISVAMFGAAVAFFNSEWSEMILPGF